MNRTKLQNSAIHANKTKSGISDENYRALILAITKDRTDSSKDLDTKEADKLIEALGGTSPGQLAKRRRRTERKPIKRGSNVTELASDRQQNYLTYLAVQRWGSDRGAQSLRKFCKSTNVIGKPKPLTAKEASKAIEALKSLNKREPQTTH
jgi:hypothetical protein